MKTSLLWNTVRPELKAALSKLMLVEGLEPFRVVGGTALSLQVGHRISDDIDLFSSAEYGSIDFDEITHELRRLFEYIDESLPGVRGPGRSYFVGQSINKSVKLDVYHTESFIYPPVAIEDVRLASIPDIIAMKIDVIQRTGRKKDFWDLHELIDQYEILDMIEFHRIMYPFSHDPAAIMKNLVKFESADNDFDPRCLRGKHWEMIKLDFTQIMGGVATTDNH